MAWTFAAQTAALGERAVIAANCLGQPVAVYRVNEEYFASSDVCPHQGAALSAGCVVDGFIECPLHFALFDIRTGAADGSVTASRLKTFQTRVENGEIHVDIGA
jgi:nitrite reductase/ring-hydroxylating ferredoxin subunit